MMSNGELDRFREELATDQQWRNVSCHVIAELLEACALCGTVREKERLNQCQWCEDTYCCKDGLCSEQHRSSLHAAVAYWTW